MRKIIYRTFEELLPFFAFLKNKRNIQKKIVDPDELEKISSSYVQIEADCLENRIKEEHERGVKIDDKTSKFTLGLSVSLTVLATVSGSVAKYLPDSSYPVLIAVVCGISALYMLLAGIIALGALKTLPTYGYGTHHIISVKDYGGVYLAKALFAQERMNNIRHLRNEAAYQSLRNGFILLFFALLVSVLARGADIKVQFQNLSKVSATQESKEAVDKDDATLSSQMSAEK